jgi:hypothetical protein
MEYHDLLPNRALLVTAVQAWRNPSGPGRRQIFIATKLPLCALEPEVKCEGVVNTPEKGVEISRKRSPAIPMPVI